ncbi:aminotransferase class III-fold pyridoxal phosphate-dependent enzyme [soil metagenome]
MSLAFKSPVPVETPLLERARAVIPGGMYGHQDIKLMWPGAPQFLTRGEGAYIWDTEGKRYIDLMCSYGPIVLGHRHPKVEAAVRAQMSDADCQNTPAPVIVDLAERMVSIVNHADWAMFMKNGSDANTLALTIARAATGRKSILVAKGAYHGAAPWCNPNMHGITPEDRANLSYYTYNDIGSVDAALSRCENDLAAIIVSPFRHDAGLDQELVQPEFARHLRTLCDRKGAVLILDDVRCGFRLNFGSSWESLGVEPDLSAWSKAMGNGYPIAALLGNDRLRDAAGGVFATGSFWFSAVPMAATLATLDVLEREKGADHMRAMGEQLFRGLRDQAASLGLSINVTGHPTMPYLTFANETGHELTTMFAAQCAALGLYVHPRHNWFMSTAIDEPLMKTILGVTERALSIVKSSGRAP